MSHVVDNSHNSNDRNILQGDRASILRITSRTTKIRRFIVVVSIGVVVLVSSSKSSEPQREGVSGRNSECSIPASTETSKETIEEDSRVTIFGPLNIDASLFHF